MTPIVLDASALLAMLRDEAGGAMVAGAIAGARMSAVFQEDTPGAWDACHGDGSITTRSHSDRSAASYSISTIRRGPGQLQGQEPEQRPGRRQEQERGQLRKQGEPLPHPFRDPRYNRTNRPTAQQARGPPKH